MSHIRSRGRALNSLGELTTLLSKIIIITILSSFFLFSGPVLAGPAYDPPDGADETRPEDVALDNPIGTDRPQELIGRIIRGLLGIVGSLALAVFTYGGFIWMTAAGSPDRVRHGKNTITWAALGLVLIFSSYAITRLIIETLTKSF